MSPLTYKEAGVDTALKADMLARLRQRVKPGRAEVIAGIGGFGGLFRAPTGKEVVLVATTDGVGTKTEIARLLDRHEVIGTDVVHQSINDALAVGAEPLFFLDYFATSKLEPIVFDRIVDAVAAACAENGCALLGGETAEMPGTYVAGAYDVAGFLVGAVERDAILDPKNVREGDALIGIPSNGLHTNGYTLARAIIGRAAGQEARPLAEWLGEQRRDLEDRTIGDALLAAHRSYLAEYRALRDAVRIRSIAHLTGGGWEGNVPRALPAGLGADIDRASWSVPRIFTLLAELGRVKEQEAFNTWNMGIGLVVVIDRQDRSEALNALPDAVELGRVVARDARERVRLA